MIMTIKLTGGYDLSTLTAYCAVSGCGGYCLEKYDSATTGGAFDHVNMCVNWKETSSKLY
jgi:hypothetical protein